MVSKAKKGRLGAIVNPSQNNLQLLEEARRRLKERYGILNNWALVGEEFGIPGGTAHAVAHGREPKKPETRKALGLPELGQAPICPICNVVHTKSCRKSRYKYKDLFSTPVEVLLFQLQNRRSYN